MAKKWLVGMVAAIAAVSLAGVGFSAFTAQAVVYGSATAATMNLEIVSNGTFGCYGNVSWILGAPGSIAFSGENAAHNAISLTVANLTPGVDCRAYVGLENTGSVPVNVSVALYTPGVDGVCTAAQLDCYDMFTTSGVQANGWIWYSTSPSAGTSSYSYTDFTTLAPGHTYFDYLGVDIPAGSDDGTPSSAVFTLVYTASSEFGH